MKTNQERLQALISGDEGRYSYLFPNRMQLPEITTHPFIDALGVKTNPSEEIVRVVMDIQYIGWTAKVILGINLLPFQIAILQTLFTKPYPMLVASRGGSKSFTLAVYCLIKALIDPGVKIVIVGAGLRQAKLVFNYIDAIWNSAPVLRSIVGTGKKAGPKQNVDMCYFRIGESMISAVPLGDGCASADTMVTYENCFGTIAEDQPSNQIDKKIVNRLRSVWGNAAFRDTDESYCNGKQKTKKITTKKGFEFNATHNHRLKVLRNKKIEWVRMDEILVGDRIMIDRSKRWHNGDTDITKEEAYAIGCLVGDGCYTDCYKIGYSTTDTELAEAVQKLVPIKQCQSDPQHWSSSSKPQRTALLEKFGISDVRGKYKSFPNKILCSSRQIVSSFISGLFDTDGHVQIQTKKGGIGITVGFTNTSMVLVKQLQYILTHYGIVSHVGNRKRKPQWNRCYELLITGADVKLFYDQIGFRLSRKRVILETAVSCKTRWVNIDDEIPEILDDMKNVSKEFRSHGTYSGERSQRLSTVKIATYPKIRRFLDLFGNIDDTRVRRIKALFETNAYYDTVVSIEDDECVTFDIHVPDGHEYCANGFYSHNSKIRGIRANVIIADEFASIPEEIFNVVVEGFGATSKSPVEAARSAAIDKRINALGLKLPADAHGLDKRGGNQVIISGTAYYAFNHFCKWWNRYREIIQSRGDRQKIAEAFGGDASIPENFDWRDYAVIRIPYTSIQEGLLDARHLAHAKAILPKNIWLMEYGAVFMKDSDGFYSRLLIEACTPSLSCPIMTQDGAVVFTPQMRGVKGRTYVFGIDPAAERDNLAITVLEKWPHHFRIVYCWAVNRPEFLKRKRSGIAKEDDYYAYCCSKIRSLVRLFAPERIEMDKHGGGLAIAEMLRNKKLMSADGDNLPIYEIIETDNPKITDGESDGPHIIHLIAQDNEWNAQSNVFMHKSLETKRLLFPAFDTVKMQAALMIEKAMSVTVDTYEDNVNEIEELKNELTTIQLRQTPGGKEKFDTPDVSTPSAIEGRKIKGRLRKDRYSSLLFAHRYCYDSDISVEVPIDYNDVAGNIAVEATDPSEGMYRGPRLGSFRNASDWTGAGDGNMGAVKRSEIVY